MSLDIINNINTVLTAKAIVEIFENGKIAAANYSSVVYYPNDLGGLTYGKYQLTLNSGNLYLCLKDYIFDENEYTDELIPYLCRVKQKDKSLNTDKVFKELLVLVGHDTSMQLCQDRFFDRIFWQPSSNFAKTNNFVNPLSYAVIFDSNIHGSFKRIADQTSNLVSIQNEKDWISTYVDLRYTWLKNHNNSLLRRTVYRMEVFKDLIEKDLWQLTLPLNIRGVNLTYDSIGGGELTEPLKDVVKTTAEDKTTRLLMFMKPVLYGNDVKNLQKRLSELLSVNVNIDGYFGINTKEYVKMFQKSRKITADGIVGPVTRAMLQL